MGLKLDPNVVFPARVPALSLHHHDSSFSGLIGLWPTKKTVKTLVQSFKASLAASEVEIGPN